MPHKEAKGRCRWNKWVTRELGAEDVTSQEVVWDHSSHGGASPGGRQSGREGVYSA